MTKLMYRGYEVRAANDNTPKSAVHEDLVYRGTHHDPKVSRGVKTKTNSKQAYRGATAA